MFLERLIGGDNEAGTLSYSWRLDFSSFASEIPRAA